MQKRRKTYLSKISFFKLLFPIIALLLFWGTTAKAGITDNNLLILEPVVQKYMFKDYAYAYETNGRIYISLPKMSLYTGLKYKLSPKQLILWLANEDKTPTTIDIEKCWLQPYQKPQEQFSPKEILIVEDTLFLSENLWSKILKGDVYADKLNMRLILEREKDFPTVAKLKAEEKRSKNRYTLERDTFRDYEFDNRWFGTPVADLSLSKGWSHSKNIHQTHNSDSYSLNLAMLAAGLDVNAYFYGDSYNERKPRIRLSGSRNFLEEPPNGLNLKTLKIGDLTGLNSSYFANAGYGRGAAVSSFKDLVMSANKTIDIVGPLQDGWQVELYLNNQLIGYRQNGEAGQYNFPSIPVSYGLNVFKLVFYGPYGETRTETKRYYSGTSPVSKGEIGYNISAYQPYRYLFENNEPFLYKGKDIPVIDMTSYYGATDNLTLMGGITQTPDAKNNMEKQQFAMAGAQVAVDGSSIQYNIEQNIDTKNYAHHAEWQGNVYIGNIYVGYDKFNHIHSPISFYGTEYLDSQLDARLSGVLPYNMPYYLSYREGKQEVGKEKFKNYSARVSKQITRGVNWTLEDNYYNNANISYNTIRNSIYTWSGKYSTQTWFEYETSRQELTEFSARVDWRAGRNTYLSAQYTRDIANDMDYLSFSGGHVYSFGGLTATLETDRDLNISAYLTYNISFAKEPARKRLIKTGSTKLSRRGTVYAKIHDENNEPVEGVGLNANGLEKEVYTDKDGIAVLTDLQTYEKTIVSIDMETLPDVSLQPQENHKKLVLHPGTIRTIDLPLIHRGAVEGKLANPFNRRMFGYKITAVDEKNQECGETFADIEGYFILDGIPYGTYTLAVEKDGDVLAKIENQTINDVVIFLPNEIDFPQEPPKDDNPESRYWEEDEDIENAEEYFKEDIELIIFEDPPYPQENESEEMPDINKKRDNALKKEDIAEEITVPI